MSPILGGHTCGDELETEILASELQTEKNQKLF